MINNPDSVDYCVLFVTASSEQEAEAIAKALVEAQLAACVNIMPVHSIYTWSGQINSDREWQMIIKTKLTKFSTISAKIKELHSYEVPEIIALPILTGSESYLQWIAENVK